MFTVILIEPEKSGNIGAVARVMQNFDLNSLILINPKTDPLNDEAMCRARHAKTILNKATVKEYSYFTRNVKSLISVSKDFELIIGTTSVLGSDYNLPRLPITPDKLAENIPKNKKIALVFGRESTGLNNSEIAVCDLIVTIPSSKNYPALNLSHAAAILFYELYKNRGENRIDRHINLTSKKEREVILERIDKILGKMQFSTPEKKETQRMVWKNIVNKGFLTKREAFALLGFLKKVERLK